MDDNLKIIMQEVIKYQNTLVLSMNEVFFLRDYYIGDDDYYYVLEDIQGKVTHSSCVGEIIPLMGFINGDAYDRLERIFNYNNGSVKTQINNGTFEQNIPDTGWYD